MSNYTPAQIEKFLQEFFDVVGTRQYIGARYVPLFGRRGEDSIVWDNSKPYEPLTIVLYQNNTYTSRTYVPTGVEITNQAYWANTGNYNAQVEMYREEVSRFNSRISTNEQNISTIERITTSNTLEVDRVSEAIATETINREQADSDLENNFNFAISEAIGGLASSTPVFVNSVDDMTSTSTIYVLSTNSHIYAYISGAWTDTGVTYTNTSNVIYLKSRVTPANMAQILPDCNYADINTFYQLTGFSSATPPLNTPFGDKTIVGGFGALMTIAGTGDIAMQIWFSQYNVWTRQINKASHTQASVWHNILERVTEGDLNISSSTAVTANDTLALYPRSTIRFLSRANGASVPVDTPYALGAGYWQQKNGPVLILSQTTYGASYFIQLFIDNTHIWKREVANNGTPNSDWQVVAGDKNIYVSKTKNKALTFRSFTAACKYAYEHEWVENVIVLDGEYDLIAEIEDIYGSMDNFAASGGNNTGFIYKGLGLNHYNIIGVGNHTIKMHYAGANSWVLENVSLFTIQDSTYTQNNKHENYRIENLNLEGSRLRYLIHDDPTSNANIPFEQHHIIKGCTLKFNNTLNNVWNARQIIGGGLGTASIVEIVDNIFIQQSDTGSVVCSYHNNRGADAQSKIIVKGNYANRGTFRFSWFGDSPKISYVLCHDNSITVAPFTSAESESYETENVIMYAWNNEIRN